MFDFTGVSVYGENAEEKLACSIASRMISERYGSTPRFEKSGVCIHFKCISGENAAGLFASGGGDKNGVGIVDEKDCCEIKLNGCFCKISAVGIRGLIYGLGRFLRKCEFSECSLTLIEDISGVYKPFMSIRGHQLGYRPLSNTYDAWSPESYRQYILDMMMFGCNVFEHTIVKREETCHLMRYSFNEIFNQTCSAARELDVGVSVWFPEYCEDDTLSREMKDDVFAMIPKLDYYFPPGSDPGELDAGEFLKRTSETSVFLKKKYSNVKVYPSAQTPDITSGWGDEFIKILNESDCGVDGVILGPNRAFDLDVLRKKLSEKYPIRFYPDITHNVRCEYPVHFNRDDWHFSLASTLGRESVNPRPTELRTLHRLTRDYVIGSVSYSEGVNDDVNKFVWSDMDFSPDVDISDTLRDYSRLFFPCADADKVKDAILGLEKNWCGDPAENPTIDYTLETLENLAEETPSLLKNYRFLLLLFRGKCDKYVKMRRVRELGLIEKARKYLENYMTDDAERVLSADGADVFAALRSEIFSLAKNLFELIGLQTDVSHFGAHSWERGATLETIDNPVTDRLWLLNRLNYAKSLPDGEKRGFINRLLYRDKKVKGEYHFSFSLNGIDETGYVQEPGFYMNFIGDNPNINNGCIPMAMLNVYDHYSLKLKIGGLTDKKGYELLLNIKPKYNDLIDDFTIEINSNTVYRGKLYGGRRDFQFEKEMGAPGFEAHVYDIAPSFITGGCADLTITEKYQGFMICEVIIRKKRF